MFTTFMLPNVCVCVCLSVSQWQNKAWWRIRRKRRGIIKHLLLLYIYKMPKFVRLYVFDSTIFTQVTVYILNSAHGCQDNAKVCRFYAFLHMSTAILACRHVAQNVESIPSFLDDRMVHVFMAPCYKHKIIRKFILFDLI
jgi:hypothetical protein